MGVKWNPPPQDVSTFESVSGVTPVNKPSFSAGEILYVQMLPTSSGAANKRILKFSCFDVATDFTSHTYPSRQKEVAFPFTGEVLSILTETLKFGYYTIE